MMLAAATNSTRAATGCGFGIVLIIWTEAFGAPFDLILFVVISCPKRASNRFFAQVSKALLEHPRQRGCRWQLITSRT
jgi:hypothetical protein